MKSILKPTLLASLLIFGTAHLYAAPAGAGHSHGGAVHVHEEISQDKALDIATSMKNVLAKKGTIAKSWTGISASQIEKKLFGKNEEWVVSFNNLELEDKTKQVLYVFVSLTGKVTGANYTGN